MADSQPAFDPLAMLAALDRQRVTYIVVGGFARVIQGAEETTRGVDLVPSMREENLRRLDLALQELNARTQSGDPVSFDESEPVVDRHNRPRRTQARLGTGRDRWIRRPSPSG